MKQRCGAGRNEGSQIRGDQDNTRTRLGKRIGVDFARCETDAVVVSAVEFGGAQDEQALILCRGKTRISRALAQCTEIDLANAGMKSRIDHENDLKKKPRRCRPAASRWRVW